jgi:hypothetical protein
MLGDSAVIDRRRPKGYCFHAMIVPTAKIRVRRDEDSVFIGKSELLPGCHAHRRDRGEALIPPS